MTPDQLKKRIIELADSCFYKDILTYTPFLTPEEQDIFLRMQRDTAGVRFLLTGGYEAAERRLVLFLPSYMEADDISSHPITWIRIRPAGARFAESLTHRDYLGAVMSLGIERDRTGDIVIAENTAHMAVLRSLSDYLCENLTSVKHTRVIAEEEPLPDSLRKPALREITGTVASVRLDALISTAFRMARGTSQDTIKAGYVFIDGRQTLSPSASVKPGSVISVRHRGKFAYLGEEGTSKKGRTVIRLGIYT